VEEWLLEEKKDIPEFGQKVINGKGESPTPEEKSAWEGTLKIISEFKTFDLYVVATPMWNFNVPAKLINLIDVLAQAGHTFEYVDGAARGLLANKKVLFVCAHMGAYPNGVLDNDFQLPYLRHMFNFMGVSEQKDIAIDFSFKGDEADVKPLEQAKALAADWL